MSICRFSDDCEVYMYPSGNGFQCCDCKLGKPPGFVLGSVSAAMVHLLDHIRAGHMVPNYALLDLVLRGVDGRSRPLDVIDCMEIHNGDWIELTREQARELRDLIDKIWPKDGGPSYLCNVLGAELTWWEKPKIEDGLLVLRVK